MRAISVFILSLSILVSSSAADAGDYDDYMGEEIVIKDWGAEFRLPEGVVGTAELGNVYRIDKVNGNWLWVTSAGGWISINDVVLREKAEDFFTKRVKKDPKPDTYFERGMARLRMGEHKMAMIDFDQAITNKKAPHYFNARGIAWLEQGEPQKAINDHNQALKYNPKLAAGYYNRGNARMALKQYAKAISDYNLSLRINPKNGRAYVNRGLCWHKRRDYVKAVADFDKACELNPRWPLAYNNRADSKNRMGEFDEALKDCELALKYDPKLAWAMVNRGNAWLGKKEFAKAMADYNAAVRAQENFAPAYNNRANAFASTGEFAKAIKDYRKSIELDPEFAPAYNGWAWLTATCPEKNLRDPDQAMKLALTATHYDNTEWNHWGTLAAAYAVSEKWEEAVSAQETCIRMLPPTASEADKGDCKARLILYKNKKTYIDS